MYGLIRALFSNQLVSFTLPISLFHLMKFFRFMEIVMSVIKKGHFEIFFLAFSGCAICHVTLDFFMDLAMHGIARILSLS